MIGSLAAALPPRYECQSCSPAGSFNLCEGCWDKMLKAAAAAPSSTAVAPPLHTPGHTFRTVHPFESQHGLHHATSAQVGTATTH